jgi:dienelactone hydrolase
MKRFALALSLVAQPALAQTYYLVAGTDTIVAERITRTTAGFSGEMADRARGSRVTYTATVAPRTALITELSTRVFRSSADTVGDRASFTIGGDSIIARMGNAAPAHIPAAPGTVPMLNPSVAFIEQVMMRARAIQGAGAQIPILIIGAPQPMSATVRWVGADSGVLQYAGVTMQLAVSSEGRVLGGSIPAQRLRIVRSTAANAPLAAARDYSAPREAPYTSEDVVVTTRAGLKLSGTLTIPRGRVGGRAPAIVTITGSGSEDRDGEPPALRGYRPFRELADTLGKRGIAVLRLDDRGLNGSDIGPLNATSEDFADDILAGVTYLRRRDEIDPTRIGLVGHSEGAMIAPMVAKVDGQLRGLVLMAGAASLGRDIVRSQHYYVVDTMQHLTGAQRTAALAQYQKNTDSIAKTVPWMKFFLDYEPATLARQIETPVLILHGETDHQVPASEAERLATAFRTAGNRSVTVRRFPETNHLFVADASGGFDYAKLPSLRVRREVLGAIADWLAERFR